MEIETVPLEAVADSVRASKSRVQDVQSYTLSVQSALGPKVLDGRGLKGRVLVAFSVSANGALTNARIARSSGEQSLDMQALQIVGRAALPAPPPGIGATYRSYVSAFTFA